MSTNKSRRCWLGQNWEGLGFSLAYETSLLLPGSCYACTGPEVFCMYIQRRKEWRWKKNSKTTKLGWTFLFFGDLREKSWTVPWFLILGYFANVCSDIYKDVLISELCPKETALIREGTELQPGLRIIRNHESFSCSGSGTPSKELQFQHLQLSWALGRRTVGEGVVFGLVIHPAAAEHAQIFTGRKRAGNMTTAM